MRFDPAEQLNKAMARVSGRRQDEPRPNRAARRAHQQRTARARRQATRAWERRQREGNA